MNILDKIVARKREEIAFSKSKISVEELKNSEYFGRETFSLKESVGILKDTSYIAQSYSA